MRCSQCFLAVRCCRGRERGRANLCLSVKSRADPSERMQPACGAETPQRRGTRVSKVREDLDCCPEPQLGSCHQQRAPGLIILSESFVTFNSEGKDLFPFFSLNLHGFLFRRKKGRERGNLHLAMRETVCLVLEMSCVI